MSIKDPIMLHQIRPEPPINHASGRQSQIVLEDRLATQFSQPKAIDQPREWETAMGNPCKDLATWTAERRTPIPLNSVSDEYASLK